MKKSNSTYEGKLNEAVRAVFPGHTKAFVEQVTAVIENVPTKDMSMQLKQRKTELTYQNTSLQVECHIQMESPQEDTSLIFEPDVNPRWTEGLKMCDTRQGEKRRQTLYYYKRSKPYRPWYSLSRENCDWHCSADLSCLPSFHSRRVPPSHFSHNKSHQCRKRSNYQRCVGSTCESESPQWTREGDSSQDVKRGVGLFFKNRWWYWLYRQVETQYITERHWTCCKNIPLCTKATLLRDEGLLEKSNSPYASLVMCVRKKDDTLKLSIDFHEVNKKALPDHLPIPRVQDIIDGLGRNSRFSLLDQGKVYHQGFMSKESRPITAWFSVDPLRIMSRMW